MYELRWYQSEAIEETWSKLRLRPGNPVIELPTGAGKSIVLAEMMRQALQRWPVKDRKIRVLLLTHQKELIEQNHQKLTALAPDIDIGVNSASVGTRDYDNDAIFAGIQSVYKHARRITESGEFSVVFVDEAHLISTAAAQGMYRTLLDQLREKNPRLKVIGLTATPYRLQGGVITKQHPSEGDKLFDYVSYSLPVSTLIDEGFVSQPVNLGTACEIDRSSLAVASTGDFKDRDQEAAFEEIGVDIVADMLARVREKDLKSVLIFCTTLDQGKHLHEYLIGQGCAAEYVDGMTDKKRERPAILQRFKDGHTQYLINIGVLTTGFDAPNIDCIVLMRSTTSPGLYVQMVGRGLRVTEDKDRFYVLDYGGNISTHGPLDDISTDSLFNKEAEEKEAGWKCRVCQTRNPLSANECLECGTLRPPPEKREIKLQDADDAKLLKRETTRLRRRVFDYRFDYHRSKNNPDNPPCIKVTYRFRLGETSKWIFPEADGRFRNTFEKWWLNATGADDAPTSTDRALEILDGMPDDKLHIPDYVEIVMKPNEKFPKVVELWEG